MAVPKQAPASGASRRRFCGQLIGIAVAGVENRRRPYRHLLRGAEGLGSPFLARGKSSADSVFEDVLWGRASRLEQESRPIVGHWRVGEQWASALMATILRTARVLATAAGSVATRSHYHRRAARVGSSQPLYSPRRRQFATTPRGQLSARSPRRFTF